MSPIRLRKLRKNDVIRDWVSETQLRLEDIILPYFIVEGRGIRKPIRSMPGICHLSIDNLLNDLSDIMGIQAILLFGIPAIKDNLGTQAYRKDGIVQRAVKAIKKRHKELIVITDVCLCGYSSHGHCGIVKDSNIKYQRCKIIDNDATLKILSKIALSHAESGVDLVAPSAMMDGQVHAIRESLDKKGFKDVGILAYSAKYASNFYGPFREALNSAPQFGDRKSYQMDTRNSHEALREIEQDIAEGADIVMIKPALAYLDIIYRTKQRFNVPIAAYNVSGEYGMIESYCQGQGNNKQERTEIRKRLVLEVLTAIKRSGADFIITYYGKEIGRWIN
jgi:porphobilinogen synthase